MFKDFLQIFWHTLKLRALILYKLVYAIVPIIVFLYNPYCGRKTALKNLAVIALNPTCCFNNFKDLFRSRQIIVNYGNYYYPIAASLNSFIALAWICEKMKIDIKIKHPSNMVWHHFKNHEVINTTKNQRENLTEPKEYFFHIYPLLRYGLFTNSSEYGYKIISKLSIKNELKRTADQWYKQHIKGNSVAVHYRGTDVVALKEVCESARYRIDLDQYIIYLKRVLDNQCSIFACSDQAQFIDKMYKAFPGRVAARDIQRSYDDTPIHLHGYYKDIDNSKQEENALIDILVLAKTKFIYTNGSSFVDIVRYFNPKTKIIALDGRGRGRISGNVLPIPQKDLFNKLCIK